ncbi:MAG: ATP-binding protein [Clostridia bacterium]|nr:ATP-binding protein [Clostridia bacterium]
MRLLSLSVLRDLLEDPVLQSLLGYLDSLEKGSASEGVSCYGEFVSKLYKANGGFLGDHIMTLCENSDNVYVGLIGRGKTPPLHIEQSIRNELATLNDISRLTPEILLESLDVNCPSPSFASGDKNVCDEYMRRCENVGKYGYGIYTGNHMFYLDDSGAITPVMNPDPVTEDSLVGYHRERRKVYDNTLALLSGKPAANVLLTGDAGTGKSTAIKAVANALWREGLRVIELRKNQLTYIPELLDRLALNPLKFILYIDDLSFQSDDDNFNALKAVLEGSVSARSRNVVIYATSNRRHIIKEKFSDREGDDIHRNDTVQEFMSLSDRFGIHITFSKPDKASYLCIVKELAKQKGITMPEEELEMQAERFALERGGRSPRLAKQFTDLLMI